MRKIFGSLEKINTNFKDFPVKWIKAVLNLNDINIRQNNNGTSTIDGHIRDTNISIEIVIRDEASTLKFSGDDGPDNEASLNEMEMMAADYSRYINMFSSNGIWERPRDYKE